MDSGGGTSTTVQQSEPWKGQIPYLTQGFQNAQQWYDSPNPQYYNFDTTIPYSTQTQQALDQQQQIATSADPLISGAQATNAQLMSGGQNPYLDATFNQAAGNLATNFRENVNPRIDSYYGQLGGSPMNPSMLQSLQSAQKSQYNDPMVNLATDIYGGAYNEDQNRRLQALQQVPTTYNLQYSPTQQLGQVGAANEAKSLEELQAKMSEYQFNQNQPLDKLQQYMQLVGGANYGGTTTTTGPNPYASNPYGDIGSMGLMAAMLPKMASHSILKTNIEVPNRKDVLRALASLPILRWQYKGDEVRHLGPMAEDFQRAFGIGDGFHIALGDWLGVLTIAIQEITA